MIMRKPDKPNPCIAGAPLAVLLLLLLLPLNAAAYLDPTTGSMLISAIVGLFASLVLAIKTYWYRLKGFFSRKPEERRADDESG
jgi:hypothetical protein